MPPAGGLAANPGTVGGVATFLMLKLWFVTLALNRLFYMLDLIGPCYVDWVA